MTYTTKQGDMWDSISKKLYGNEKYTEQLMKANTANISTVVFPAGIVLTVPDVDTTANANASSLPPWRS
jgi:phage tail protein X